MASETEQRNELVAAIAQHGYSIVKISDDDHYELFVGSADYDEIRNDDLKWMAQELLRLQRFEADADVMMGASDGAFAIMQERHRQITREGFDAEHDAKYQDKELLFGALCYLKQACLDAPLGKILHRKDYKPPQWPFAASWWKPKGFRDCLVKAGALIAAALDRHDRDQQPRG